MEKESWKTRRGWIDDTRDWIRPVGSGRTNITYGDIKRSAENREQWREMVKEM